MKYTLAVLLLILAALTACDQKLAYSEVFEFEAIDYKTVRICNNRGRLSIGYRYLSGSVRIPATIYGKKVVAIDKEAFYGCDHVTQFIIPSTVKTIGAKAFASCNSLTSVVFEDPYGWKSEDIWQKTTPVTLTDPKKNAEYLKKMSNRWAKGSVSESQPETKKENSNMKDKNYRVREVNFTMKPIAAVTGTVLGDKEQSNNQEHTVNLSAYYIGETEVTQELWQAVMGNNPSHFTSSKKNPVESISWYDSIVFCNELTQKLSGLGVNECVYYRDASLSAVYTAVDGASHTIPHVKWSAKGFRLPTEAEWEYAAMGGQNHKYAGTDTETELTEYAWYKVNSDNKTHEVGTKKANKYGLYDMSGNVWEWCWDWYSSSTPASGQTDPQGASFGSRRVLRGGGWDFGADSCKRTNRGSYDPGNRYNIHGLRLVTRQ